MTREEELDWLCRLRSEIYVYMPKEWLIPMNNALDMAIKVVEQESILDKIRAEIEKIPTTPYATAYTAKKESLAIIDKYKSERSDKE